MARTVACAAILLALTTEVRSQFFADLFQSYQPFLTSPPTSRQIYDDTSRRIKTDQNRRHYNRGTTKYEQTSEASDRRNDTVLSQISSIERDNASNSRRRKTTVSINTTTVKPRKTDSSRRITNSNKREQGTQVDYNNGKEYDGKVNSISDYYTQKPNYETNRGTDYDRWNNYESNNRGTNYDRNNNYYTTHNPLINRPGVRPAVVDNRPPITNRPVTRRPNYGTNPSPKDDDAIAFPDAEVSPEVILGPDEDFMSQVEKRRYIELAERMCDKYKSLTTKAVQAIPLLPSPEPVRVNVSGCVPVNVPLVVGGRVVRINEFPHMALLGWRKLEDAGYSWKCGGSLVSEQFVLTAAHCSYQDRDNTVVNGPPRAVQLGSSYLDDPGGLVVKVASVIRHPKYKQPRSYNDLALVKLVNAVKFSDVIKPACIGVPPAVGKSVIATGWGRTEYGGDQSHELRSVSLPVWNMAKCREVLGTSRKLPDGPSSDSQICAGEERGGKDTCQGDSGGPAQIQDGCIWRVVAVTSLGRSCGAAETPGLYAVVHRAFVASQIFGNSKDFSNNNGNYGSNNENYGSNNGNYGSNNENYGSNNGNYGSNNENYGSNNRQQVSTTQRINNANYPANQVYSTRPPDRDYANNYGGDRPSNNNYNYNQQSADNGQNYNTQRPNFESSYTTQRPNRNDNSGIVFNYNNDYNSQENNRNGYTTRKPIRNSDMVNSDYVNNNYNQNYGSNNRGQTNYDRNNNYGSNNDNYSGNQDAQNNYGVNRPWWST